MRAAAALFALAQADCCCSVVKDLAEALADPQFGARGLFDHRLGKVEGEVMAALPLPLSPAFRGDPEEPLAAPALGAENDRLLGPEEP